MTVVWGLTPRRVMENFGSSVVVTRDGNRYSGWSMNVHPLHYFYCCGLHDYMVTVLLAFVATSDGVRKGP